MQPRVFKPLVHRVPMLAPAASLPKVPVCRSMRGISKLHSRIWCRRTAWRQSAHSSGSSFHRGRRRGWRSLRRRPFLLAISCCRRAAAQVVSRPGRLRAQPLRAPAERRPGGLRTPRCPRYTSRQTRSESCPVARPPPPLCLTGRAGLRCRLSESGWSSGRAGSSQA